MGISLNALAEYIAFNKNHYIYFRAKLTGYDIWGLSQSIT
jgi:hypothetical protein